MLNICENKVFGDRLINGNFIKHVSYVSPYNRPPKIIAHGLLFGWACWRQVPSQNEWISFWPKKLQCQFMQGYICFWIIIWRGIYSNINVHNFAFFPSFCYCIKRISKYITFHVVQDKVEQDCVHFLHKPQTVIKRKICDYINSLN
jgi:hypothetical protein